MIASSIFHNLVTVETDYTQLLCNLLQSNYEFRQFFLNLAGLSAQLADSILPKQITTQLCMPSGCRPDLTIKNERMEVVIEVKTTSTSVFTPSQEFSISPGPPEGTYLRHLEESASRGLITQLVLLVPAARKDRSLVNKKITAWHRKKRSTKIKLLTWEDLTTTLETRCEREDSNSVMVELSKLLHQHFGRISFTAEDCELFTRGSYIQVVRKIDALIGRTEEFAKGLGGFRTESSWQDVSEVGFTISRQSQSRGVKKRQRDTEPLLWFGSYTPRWEKNGQPLAIGVLAKNNYCLSAHAEWLERIDYAHQDWTMWAIKGTLLADPDLEIKLQRLVSESLTRITSH